jgi:methylglutamate dehydrogenase subunit D
MLDVALHRARHPAEGLLRPVGANRGVVAAMPDLQFCSVIVRRPPMFEEGARESLGLRVVDGPKRASGRDVALLGVGPGRWLAMCEARAPRLATQLERSLGSSAAVTDQSDAYATIRLSGPKARATLEKGIAVDLHPRAFAEDDVAATTCGHLNVIIWRMGDSFDIAAPRSYSADFCRWLMESAAEHGLAVAVD